MLPLPLLLCAALVTGAASAHEFWIRPHGDNGAGKTISLSAHIGENFSGEQASRIPGQVDTFSIYYNDGSPGIPVSGRDNTFVFGHHRSQSDGSKIAVLTTNKFDIRIKSDEFNKYLDDEGLDQALRLRSTLGVLQVDADESFYRIAKAVIGEAKAADRVFALPLEISAASPRMPVSGTDFAVKVTANGHPLAHRQVKARPLSPLGELQIQRTDPSGVAMFRLNQPGLWAFGTTSIAYGGGVAARWQSVWSSMTLTIGTEK